MRRRARESGGSPSAPRPERRDVAPQSNGYVGETRTAGLLGRHFVIHTLSIDRDGADFLVTPFGGDAADARQKARGIQPYGVIQAKYFEEANRVYVEEAYLREGAEARHNFFLLIHTDDADWNGIHYFLTAEDALELPADNRGRRRFSITERDPKSAFRLSVSQIVARIEDGMRAYQLSAQQDYKRRINLALRLRTAHRPDPRFEYHLVNLELPTDSALPESYEAKSIVVRMPGEYTARLIDARWDMTGSTATWSWGYAGDGSRLTATSILAHYLGREREPMAEEVAAMITLVAKLDAERNHVITGAAIDVAIGTRA